MHLVVACVMLAATRWCREEGLLQAAPAGHLACSNALIEFDKGLLHRHRCSRAEAEEKIARAHLRPQGYRWHGQSEDARTWA